MTIPRSGRGGRVGGKEEGWRRSYGRAEKRRMVGEGRVTVRREEEEVRGGKTTKKGEKGEEERREVGRKGGKGVVH